MTETDEIKYISEKERARIPDGDFAGPNHTFPIDSQAHVFAAAHLIGRAADPERVKERVIAIARRKGYALPQSWTKDDDHDGDSAQDTDHDGKSLSFTDTLITYGGAVKRLDEYKFGADLVLFTNPDDPDTYGDYFDASTDFDFEDGDSRSLYYDHGFDTDLGNTKIGRFTLKMKPGSVWMEGQIDKRIEYADQIMKMIEDGDLGTSSGALSHLVRRVPVTKRIAHITHWPIGEGSLTPTPAEPRTVAIPLKTWLKDYKKLRTEEFDDEASSEMKEAFSQLNPSDFNKLLRKAGASRSEATFITAHGFIPFLRKACEDEPTPEAAISAPPLDEATKQARETKFRILSHRLEGLLLAQ